MKQQRVNLTDKKVSLRGYYYDLSQSPYEYLGYKFPSAKKLEIFIKEKEKRIIKGIQLYELFSSVCTVYGTLEEFKVLIIKDLYESMKATF